MKILLFNWQDIRHPNAGGAEVHLHEIFRRLAARGHHVTLFCSSFPGALPEETLDGIRIIRQGSRNVFNLVVPPRYRSQFRHEGFDVVVDDINKIPFYTPFFVREPLVGILHHLFGKSIFLEAPVPAAVYVAAAEYLALRVYRRTPFAVVSKSTRNELIRNGFDPGRIVIVPNGVDLVVHRPEPPAVPTNRPVIGHLGRLKKYKSVDHLLRGFSIILAHMPDAELVIVGDGDARPGLESLARSLSIAHRVRFTGHVSEAEKVRLINSMTVVVNPSAKEGWGLTVIEANACGIPVVASDVPGLRDSVVDGITGVLYEYANIEQMVEKIMLVVRDENFRGRLAGEARAWAQTFDWDVSASTMLEVLETAVRDRAKDRRES